MFYIITTSINALSYFFFAASTKNMQCQCQQHGAVGKGYVNLHAGMCHKKHQYLKNTKRYEQHNHNICFSIPKIGTHKYALRLVTEYRFGSKRLQLTKLQ